MKTNLMSLAVAWLLAFACTGAMAQTDPLQTAFAQSYEQEAKGQYAAAAATLKAAYSESSYEANLRLGWLSYAAGQHAEAVKYYEKAIALMPYGVEARFGLVLPASKLGNWTQVAEQYKKILETDPQNSKANYNLGLIYYNSKDYANAAKHFEKVVNLYPFDYNGLLMCAWTNLNLAKYREAKVLFGKVLLASPKDASALDGLSRCK